MEFMENKTCKVEIHISIDAKGNFANAIIKRAVSNTMRRLRKIGTVKYTATIETEQGVRKLKSRL